MPDYNVERFSPVRARAMAENELMDIEQANRRNALLESTARRQEQQFAMEMQDREAQKQQALLAQHTDWIKNAIVTARQNPQVIPSLVSEAKQRGLLPPEVQTLEPADVEELALHYGVAPQEAPKPEYRTVGDSLLQLGPDGPRVAYREPQRAPVEGPVNKQLITRPAGNGMVQDFAWNPRTSQREPVGEPYKPSSPAAATSIPSEAERTATNYAERMLADETLLGNYQPSVKDYMAARAVLNGGAVTASVANKALSEEGQLYYQAASDWVRAKLRKESGAVISPMEMEQEIKTYFPTPGDSAATIAQKKKAREQARTGMEQMGGRAMTPKQRGASASFGEPAKPARQQYNETGKRVK